MASTPQEWEGSDAHERLPGCVVQVKVTPRAENIAHVSLADACANVGVRPESVRGARGASQEKSGEQNLAHKCPSVVDPTETALMRKSSGFWFFATNGYTFTVDVHISGSSCRASYLPY